MKVTKAQNFCSVAARLSGVLIPLVGSEVDAVKAEDLKTPRAPGSPDDRYADGVQDGFNDRYADGVQDGFNAFVAVLTELTVEDIQEIVGNSA